MPVPFLSSRAALLSGETALLPAMSVDMDFYNGVYVGASNTLASLVQVTRASSGTDMFWYSPSGYTRTDFGNNVLRQTNGLGLISEASITQRFLNSTVPATQTISLATAATYRFWINGPGSIAVTAGTVVATGLGTASQGNYLTIVVTTPGTAVFTKTGTVNAAMLHTVTGAFMESLIVSAGATATRSADVITTIDPTLFPLSQGTVLVEYYDNVGTVTAQAAIFNARVAANNEIRLVKTSGNVFQWVCGDGTAIATLSAASAPAQDNVYRAALSYSQNKFRAAFSSSLNPGVVAVNSGGVPSGSPTISLGNLTGVQQINGVLRRVAWSPSPATATAIQRWAQAA